MTRDAPGSRTALGPSRRASSPRRRPRGACRRRLRFRRRRRGDRRSGRRLRRGDRRSGRRLPAGHRTRLCRSPGLRRSPGRRHFWSRRHGQRLGPTRGRIPSRCRRRRAGEGGDKACEVGVAPRCVRNRVRCGRVSGRGARSARDREKGAEGDCRPLGANGIGDSDRQRNAKRAATVFSWTLFFFARTTLKRSLRRSRLTAPVRGFPTAEQVPDQTQHELDHRERQEDGEEDQLQEARQRARSV